MVECECVIVQSVHHYSITRKASKTHRSPYFEKPPTVMGVLQQELPAYVDDHGDKE